MKYPDIQDQIGRYWQANMKMSICVPNRYMTFHPTTHFGLPVPCTVVVKKQIFEKDSGKFYEDHCMYIAVLYSKSVLSVLLLQFLKIIFLCPKEPFPLVALAIIS